jgi:nucleotide-binding universal stress UspA family protein
MFTKIMVPVDLEHADKLDKSLRAAADLARSYDAQVCFVAVSGKVPNRVAPTPEKFAAELDMFAREQGDRLGVETASLAKSSVDPAVELDDKLLEAIDETGADLVVMASHVPGVADKLHLISSNAAWIVKHADVSVFVVRP